jgi:hypothetical protein
MCFTSYRHHGDVIACQFRLPEEIFVLPDETLLRDFMMSLRNIANDI